MKRQHAIRAAVLAGWSFHSAAPLRGGILRDQDPPADIHPARTVAGFLKLVQVRAADVMRRAEGGDGVYERRGSARTSDKFGIVHDAIDVSQ